MQVEVLSYIHIREIIWGVLRAGFNCINPVSDI